MMITNALAVNFGSPRAWTGLLLSFVFGLLVLVSAKFIITKMVFYVLNSLVIFCVALGSNGIGTAASSSNRAASLGFLAMAQTSSDSNQNDVDQAQLDYCVNLSSTISDAQKRGASNDEILKLIAPCQAISRDIQKGQLLGGPNSLIRNPKSFFAPW